MRWKLTMTHWYAVNTAIVDQWEYERNIKDAQHEQLHPQVELLKINDFTGQNQEKFVNCWKKKIHIWGYNVAKSFSIIQCSGHTYLSYLQTYL